MKKLLLIIGVLGVKLLITSALNWNSDLRLKFTRTDREDGKAYDNQLSIVLVFDTTVSRTDFDNLRDTCFEVLEKLEEGNFNDMIYNYILVPFSDSYESNIIKIRDKKGIKSAINKIKIHTNKDCQEPVLTSLIRGLDTALPKSIAFVFTDASASDANRRDEVLKMISDNNFTIIFFVTNYCNNKMEEYAVYNRIARKSKGQLHDLNPNQITTVLDFVQTTLDKKQILLDYFSSEYRGNYSLLFTIDNTMTNFSVSITGKDIEFTLVDPNGIAYEDYIEQTVQATFKAIVNKPVVFGKWMVIYQSSVSNSIKIFSYGLLSFKFGFSPNLINNITDTKFTPHKGNNYLYILPSNVSLLNSLTDIELVLNDESFDIEDEVIFFKFPLLQMNAETNEIVYRTERFSSPSTAFKIYINGYDNARNPIRRLLSSQISPKDRINQDSLPEVSIEIKHHDRLEDVQVTCRVISLVPVNIQWLKDDVFIKEKDSDYSAELSLEVAEISTMGSKAGELKCFSRSMNGDNFSTVNIADILNEINNRTYKDIEKKLIIIEQNLSEKSNVTSNVVLNTGDDIELICVCDKCNKTDMYYWSGSYIDFTDITPEKQDNMIANRLDILNNFENSTIAYKLKIENIIHDDILECKLGDLSTKFNLSVNMKPELTLINEESEQNLNVKIGETLFLNCTIRSKPEAKYRWYKNGIELNTKNANKLIFNAVELSDDGNYQCEGRNYLGKVFINFILTVLYEPRIVKISDSTEVLQFSEFSLECVAIGNPLPVITWMRDQRAVLSSSIITADSNIINSIFTNESIYLDNKNNGYKTSSLEFKSLKQTSLSGLVNISNKNHQISLRLNNQNMSIIWAKNYSCFAENDVGRDVKTTKLSLLKPPQFVKLNVYESIKMVLGTPSILSCKSFGIPTPTVKWLYDGKDFNNMTHKYYEGNQIIKLENIDISACGNYTCIASNAHGVISRSFIVDVLYKPVTFHYFMKQKYSNLKSHDFIEIRLNVSKDLVLECPILSNPMPFFQWYKLNPEINVETLMNSTIPLFRIHNIQESGRYKCVGFNKYGKKSVMFKVIVQKPPILKNSGDMTLNAVYGNNVIFDCELEENNLATEVFWLKNNEYIYHKNIYQKPNLMVIKKEEKLVLFNVTKSDEGEYLCYGRNDLDYVSKRFNLFVNAQVTWSKWTPWSACSSSCGPGMIRRTRSCLYPDGSVAENNECSINGNSHDLKKCFIQSCFIDDDWTEWSEWSACSRTCIDEQRKLKSIKQRSRKCNIIEKQFCGYKENDIDAVECDVPTCSHYGRNSDWGAWTPWSQCSATCGYGIQTRRRHCNSLSQNCVGGRENKRKCYLASCVQRIKCRAGFTFNIELNQCEDINECNDHPCVNNELCINLLGSYNCIIYN